MAGAASDMGASRIDDAGPMLLPIVEAERNCWTIAHSARASVVIDAADYYHFVREMMLAAEKRILIIGWDFDVRIPLEPDERGKGETLGAFMLRLAKRNPRREIDILKWSFGAMRQFLRPSALMWLSRWKVAPAIRYRYDSAHPVGSSHHQKVVVIDDCLAVCGGIDISGARWDRCEHADDEPRRRLPSGKTYAPWHDVTMVLGGPVAGRLAELGRDRWQDATGEELGAIETCPEHWPDDLALSFEEVDVAVARTRPAYGNRTEVREVEALFLDMIAAARRFIYIENQYFTAGKIAAAIAARMREDDPPEIVLVMPRTADGWLEQRAMDAARVRLARAIGRVDRLNRFRIYVPVTAGGQDIYVHAKVSIVDDRFLRVGSANLNNRSLGLDSECDIAIDAALPANRDTIPAIAGVREKLMAEHCGVSPEEMARAIEAAGGSLIGAIEAMTAPGRRRLELLDLTPPGRFDRFIADNELLDPDAADGFLEPWNRRGLWKGWQQGRRALRVRRARRLERLAKQRERS